jgi:hypothetical protein
MGPFNGFVCCEYVRREVESEESELVITFFILLP